MFFDWDEEKNELLKQLRGVSFEMVEEAILAGKLLRIVTHHNPEKYPGQKIMHVEMNGYTYCVPFIEGEKEFFLKTIYPSRKTNKNYMGRLNEKT